MFVIWKKKKNFGIFLTIYFIGYFYFRELVRRMLEEKEELRQKEVQFKEHCRQELARLQKELQ